MNTNMKTDFRIEIEKSTILPNNHSVHNINKNLNQASDANLIVTNI
jgi:hypothetical protein